MTDRSRPQDLPGYAEGDFIVQDPAQALLGPVRRPAGRRHPVRRLRGSGRQDDRLRPRRRRASSRATLSRARARRLAENLRRAGSGREYPVVADARRPPVRRSEAVLLDAPCLGTGTFARHPDARWRVTPEALAMLAAHDRPRCSTGAATVVAPGGLLLYSTCSIEPEENAEQVDRFLARHPEFRREPSERFPPPCISPEGDLMILPQRHQHGRGVRGPAPAGLVRRPA